MAGPVTRYGRKLTKFPLALLIIYGFANIAYAEPDPEDINVATAIFERWANAYDAGDYETQWRLTDPRIRYWHPLSRWKKRMKSAHLHKGTPLKYEIANAAIVTGDQLPCTEQRHCFRHGVEYILLTIRSEYSGKQPPQPEYAVMARSEEGWRFGGGTFPFRPMGETMVILDEADELRYRSMKQSGR